MVRKNLAGGPKRSQMEGSPVVIIVVKNASDVRSLFREGATFRPDRYFCSNAKQIAPKQTPRNAVHDSTDRRRLPDQPGILRTRRLLRLEQILLGGGRGARTAIPTSLLRNELAGGRIDQDPTRGRLPSRSSPDHDEALRKLLHAQFLRQGAPVVPRRLRPQVCRRWTTCAAGSRIPLPRRGPVL